jgi:tetratricopeptide (TPR) repeat protein
MPRFNSILCLILAAEATWAAVDLGHNVTRPAPPRPNLARLDSATAADLDHLRSSLNESSRDSWLELADAWSAYGYFSEADVAYARAAQLPPERNQTGYLPTMWAICLEHMGRMEKAIEQYRIALTDSREPEKSLCWYGIGRCLLRLEQADAAEDAFRQAVQYPPAKYQLAKLLVRSDRFDEAAPLLQALATSHPRAAEPAWLAAHAALLQGRPHDGDSDRDRFALATQQLMAEPDAALRQGQRAKYGQARVFDQFTRANAAGDYPSQVRFLGALLQRAWHPRYALPLASAYLQLNQPQESLRVLKDYADRLGDSAETLQIVGDAQARLGNAQAARSAWERSVNMNPTAAAYQRLANLEEGFQDTVAADRHKSRWRQCAGIELFRRNELVAAQTSLETATQLDPRADHAWFYLAEVHRLNERNAEARACYDRCLEINPDHGRALASRDRLPSG